MISFNPLRKVFNYERAEFLREMRRESTLAYFLARQTVVALPTLTIYPFFFAAFY